MLKQKTYMLSWQWKGAITWSTLYYVEHPSLFLCTWQALHLCPSWQSWHQLPREAAGYILLHHWCVSDSAGFQRHLLPNLGGRLLPCVCPEAFADWQWECSSAFHGYILCLAPQAPLPFPRGESIAVRRTDASCRTRIESPGWGDIIL